MHFSNGKESIKLEPPTDTIVHPASQPSYEPTDSIDMGSLGPTKSMPLGRIVYARAGDKGSNCNVGFFARNKEEWPWLRTLLNTEKLIELMADDFKGQKIDRMEFPNLWAVHFLLHDHLDRGVTANASYDVLGKFIAEFLRLKRVDVPVVFLEKGVL